MARHEGWKERFVDTRGETSLNDLHLAKPLNLYPVQMACSPRQPCRA